MEGLLSKQIKSPADMLKGKHYQIILFEVEERMIDDGWGNSDRTIFNVTKVYATLSLEDWEADIATISLYNHKKVPFLASIVESSVKIKIATKVEYGP